MNNSDSRSFDISDIIDCDQDLGLVWLFTQEEREVPEYEVTSDPSEGNVTRPLDGKEETCSTRPLCAKEETSSTTDCRWNVY